MSSSQVARWWRWTLCAIRQGVPCNPLCAQPAAPCPPGERHLDSVGQQRPAELGVAHRDVGQLVRDHEPRLRRPAHPRAKHARVSGRSSCHGRVCSDLPWWLTPTLWVLATPLDQMGQRYERQLPAAPCRAARLVWGRSGAGALLGRRAGEGGKGRSLTWWRRSALFSRSCLGVCCRTEMRDGSGMAAATLPCVL